MARDRAALIASRVAALVATFLLVTANPVRAQQALVHSGAATAQRPLAVGGGPDRTVTLMAVDLRRGAVRWTLPLDRSTQVASLVVDPQAHHAFVISFGNWSQAWGWTDRGAVVTVDLATRRVVRRIDGGYAAGHAAFDHPMHHLVVLDLDRAPRQNPTRPADIPPARLSVVDTRTGTLIRTITIVPVDVIEGGIMVDNATGRGYITWTGTNSLARADTRTGVALPTLALATEPAS